ncbi:MAG: UDP-N-acetylmuramoyl-tripeptide--D-alanyl-D-alanine ligase [Dehalococcoidia bacterium]|nr:UDP-N-acetylmuramoyl-tripeptide--D-alanyl-D-alanine ligase [Dehalococcoidia bacterium]
MTSPTPVFDAAFVESALGEQLRERCGPGLPSTGAAIDSREVQPGDLFIALPGEYQDGHDFAADAVARGASALLLTRPVVGLEDSSATVYYVADTLAALQVLGEAWRRVLAHIQVVGITGSVGKTTTRAFTAAVLATRFRVQATAGSLNNEIGVPLTLLRLRPETERAVIEMGMYTTGEIAQLCDWALPHAGVVLNVGPVHMERAGSIEAITRAKRELVEALPADGYAVLNIDDERVASMATHTSARVVRIGRAPKADVRASDLTGRGRDGFEFTLSHRDERRRISVGLPGTHLVMNVLAAAAVGLNEGMPLDDVAGAIEELRESPRMRVVTLANNITLLDDTYNANPGSMVAALEFLAELPGRHVALLGDMRELGPVAFEEHRSLGLRAASLLDLLYTTGDLAADIGEAARTAGLGRVQHLESAELAAEMLRAVLRPGDVLLVKGSRALALDNVVAALERELGVAS